MAKNDNQQNINKSGDYNLLNDIPNGNNSDVVAAAKIIADALSKQQVNYNNPASASQSVFRDRQNEMQLSRNSAAQARYDKTKDYKRTGNILDDFETGIKDQLLDSLAGGSFKQGIQGALNEFTKQFGFDLKDLPHEFGKHIGEQLFNSVKNSKLGSALTDKLSKSASKFLDNLLGESSSSAIRNAFKNSTSSGQGKAGQQLSGGALAAIQSQHSDALMSKLGEIGGGVAAVAAVAAIAYVLLKPLLEGIGQFIKAWTAAFNKDESLRRQRLKLAQERNEKDLKMLAEQPFKILEAAVKEWESTWDKTLHTVSQTQGYTKEDVYDLYESISERLDRDLLSSAIPATDVIEKLNSILESGLSGRIAEEFAYEATKLNAAIPTQDFTGFASTYAQIAAEVVSQGYDQEVAISRANYELEQFASNLLYSSRTLEGGFTTGLKDAASLFQSSVEIAQSAKVISNAHDISAVLTSVSAAVGSIAPDLASGIVNNVVQAAIGGNNESIVALRSLAGINAGNTEFLKALATHPQEVFVNLFKNLAQMQSMSPDNYMEVAEGLSSVFGIDMKALARVDFAQLADKVASMQINQDSLNENLALLASGESTTSAEQMKLQEINNRILDEGLAYIIDNEAGRLVQQHMWDEQLAMSMQEATYTVDIQGGALAILEGLRHAVANILNFLNPAGFVAKGVEQMIVAVQDSVERDADLIKVLAKGAVGSNQQSFTNLVTVGEDLNLVRPLIEMMGGKASVSTWGNQAFGTLENIVKYGPGIMSLAGLVMLAQEASGERTALSDIYEDRLSTGYDFNQGIDSFGGMSNVILGNKGRAGYQIDASNANRVISSMYSGFNVGKSAFNTLKSSTSKAYLGDIDRIINHPASQKAAEEARARMQSFLDSAEAAAAAGMTEAEWLATAKDYGIADIKEAMGDYGISSTDLSGYYQAQETRQGAIVEQKRKEDEQAFRDENRRFWDYEAGANGIFETAIWLPFVNDEFKPFFDSGARYDQRMDAVDLALTNIQIKEDTMIAQLGDYSEFTVIGALTAMNAQIEETFVSTNSKFQKCLADWIRYIAERDSYTNQISSAQAWNDLERAEGSVQNETLLALANAMNVFSAEELQKMDPQLQTNALLGKIIIILEAIMQQNNTTAGGLSLIDTISALGLGVTSTTNTSSEI